MTVQVGFVVALLGSSGLASAQLGDAKSRAQIELKKGAAVLDQGDFEGALARFQAAFALYASPKIHFNFGVAHRGLGHDADALDAFERFLAEARDADPELRAEAEQQTIELRPLVALVTVTCDAAGAQVAIDGRERGSTPLRDAIPMGAGRHQVLVQKAGGVPFLERIEVARGERRELKVTLAPAPRATEKIATASPRARGCDPHDLVVCAAGCEARDAASCLALADADIAAGRMQQAVASLRQACVEGEPVGCHRAGVMLDRGKGVPRDAIRAAGLYRLACDRGVLAGCNDLGTQYADGNGVAADPVRAVALFSGACDGGFATACNSLGKILFHGKAGQRDPGAAAAGFSRACQGGNGQGCANLAFMLVEGSGIPKDNRRGLSLMRKACLLGHEGACKAMRDQAIQGGGR